MSNENENVPEDEPRPEETEPSRDVAEDAEIGPNGPPRPARRSKGKKPPTAMEYAVVLGLATAGAAVFLATGGGGTMGATRSSRLEFERREAEIDRAVAEAEAAKTMTVPEEEPEDCAP